MNVSEMVKNVVAECHPVTNINGIIKRWLNRGQKIVSSKGPPGGWFWLRQWAYTFTTTADVSEYALSPLVDTSKIINLRDEDTPVNLSYVSDQKFRASQPGPTATGTPYLYSLKGFSPVQNQPSSNSVLTFVSSDTLDTDIDVTIQGLNSSSVLIQETINTNGTSSVASTNSFVRILSLSKSAQSLGTITVTSNAGGVTNVRIPPKDRHVSHPIVNLFNIPDSTATIYYDFTMKLPDIYDDDDCSLIPEQYHDAVELYAKCQCFKLLNNPTMAQSLFAEFETRLNEMRLEYKEPVGIITMDEVNYVSGFNEPQLPSYFPRSY